MRAQPFQKLIEMHADGVDLFLCEGYGTDPVRWHLDLDTVAYHRDRLTCRQLVITDLSPTALAADLDGWQVASDDWHLDV